MANHPEAIVNFEVYENSVNYAGIASVQLPNINYITQNITGAGIAGTVESVLIGMIDAMSATFNFRSCMGAAVNLLTPVKHTIDLRAAEQHWDTVNVERNVVSDKYVLVMVPKNFTAGTISPASMVDTNIEFSVAYYAAYKDGKKCWEIDPFNYICEIDGVDYMASVRQALGK
ncbi:MAG: phage major tail tube protein [Aristaeellaceae bacterium]